MMSNDAYTHNCFSWEVLGLGTYLGRISKSGRTRARPHAGTHTCGTSGVSCSRGGIGAVPSTAQTSAGREVHGTSALYPGSQPGKR